MDETQPSLFAKDDLEGFSSVRGGGMVHITYRGVAVHVWGEDDAVGRDYVVASLLQLGLTGKKVAQLCGVSEALVSGVHARWKAGGSAALAARGTAGRPAKVTASMQRRMARRRKQGWTLEAIGRKEGLSKETVRQHLARRRVAARHRPPQLELEAGSARSTAEATADEPPPARGRTDGPSRSEGAEELQPGVRLVPSGVEHRSRYAGTLLLAGAMDALSVGTALDAASVRRSTTAVYDAHQVVTAMSCAWIAGYGSLEAMHERDARSLGVVLGLERSPSVRTLHRAVEQMSRHFEPVQLGTELMRGLQRAGAQQPSLFGVDGHFKRYTGSAPLDKGWDAKRRLAAKGMQDVFVHDERGMVWAVVPAHPGDKLSAQVVTAGERLLEGERREAPVLAFDRGGFSFEVLGALDAQGFGYVAWVPSTVKLPALESIAPGSDGVGATDWEHSELSHAARLVVQRDGEALVPAATNLPKNVPPEQAVAMLRKVRGMQENGFKAARSSVHLDRLADRGGHRIAPDDRPVDNPEHKDQRAHKRQLEQRLEQLHHEHPVRGQRTRADIDTDWVLAGCKLALVSKQLKDTPKQVPRTTLEPDAQRAWPNTQNRSLLLPLKLAAENARRWLLANLGRALAPTDNDYDATATARTLTALLQAPGTVRFDEHQVVVTLELPLAPTAHRRLHEALLALDRHRLRFPDGERLLRLRLAPRPTRDDLPSDHAGYDSQSEAERVRM